ncbi:MAG: hypothetical protein JWL84_3481 [Rhodospirillales bacterium]|jgi:hypothetical protein|nr:hypothetical protein [Rhodospirillales bacterium]
MVDSRLPRWVSVTRTAGAAGGPPPTVWRVVAVYVPWHRGFEHARLKSVGGRAETMTLAVSGIADKARFVRLEWALSRLRVG